MTPRAPAMQQEPARRNPVPVAAPTPIRQGARLGELYRIARALGRSSSIEDAVAEIAPIVQEVLALQRAQILYSNSTGTHGVAWDSTGSIVRTARAPETSALDFLDFFLHGARPASVSPRSMARDAARRRDCVIVLPLVVGRGAIFGLIEIARHEALTEEELEFASSMTNDIAVAIERQRAVDAVLAGVEAVERGRASVELDRAEAQAARWSAEWLSARYEALIDGIDRAFLWTSRVDRLALTYLSGSVESVLGYRREDLLGDDRFLRTVHPDDREGFEFKIRAAVKTGLSRRFVHRCVDSAGRTLWFLTAVHVDPQTGGSVLYGFTADVTELQGERERVEQELELSETLTSSLGEAVLAVDRHLVVTFMNPAAKALLATTSMTGVGKPLSEVARIVEDVAGDTASNPITSVIEGGVVRHSEEATFIRANGAPVQVAYSATPMVDGDAVTGCVISFRSAADIQRAERMNRFLAQVSGALGSSLDYSATLATLAHLSVPYFADICFIDECTPEKTLKRTEVVFADDSKEVHADRVREAATSCGAASLQSRVSGSGDPVLIDDIEAEPSPGYGPQHREVMSLIGAKTCIVVRLASGGSVFGTLTFIMAESGRMFTKADLAVADTIAQRASTALHNARLYHFLEVAVRERQEILAIVSHDLRSPLTNVLMSARLLKAVHPTNRPNVEIIERAVVRMDLLLKDLLDVSSIEAGHLSINPTDVGLRELCDEAIQGATLLGTSKSIRVRGFIARDVRLRCDRDRILQVLGNFLSNAVKFTPAGGEIELAAIVEEGQVRLEVSDSGPGIPEAAQAHVFDRYWQARETAAAGRGLGLYIASGIIASHGGTIGVRSVVGQGSTFYCTLPAAVAAQDEATSIKRTIPRAAGSKLVLAIDHDRRTWAELEATLGGWGYQVVIRTSAAEAMDHLRNGRLPDLILLELPSIIDDGWELLREREHDPLWRIIPVVVTSADESLRARALEARAQFVRKPFHPEDLRETLLSASA